MFLRIMKMKIFMTKNMKIRKEDVFQFFFHENKINSS